MKTTWTYLLVCCNIFIVNCYQTFPERSGRSLLGLNVGNAPRDENDLISLQVGNVLPRGLLGINLGNTPQDENDLISLQVGNVLPRGLLGINLGNTPQDENDLISLQVRNALPRGLLDVMERSFVNAPLDQSDLISLQVRNTLYRGVMDAIGRSLVDAPRDQSDLISLQVGNVLPRGLLDVMERSFVNAPLDQSDLIAINIGQNNDLLIAKDLLNPIGLVDVQTRDSAGSLGSIFSRKEPCLVAICHVVRIFWGNDKPTDLNFRQACDKALESLILNPKKRDFWAETLVRETESARQTLKTARRLRKSNAEIRSLQSLLKRLEQESDEYQENLIWARSLQDNRDDALAQDLISVQIARKGRELTGRAMLSDSQDKARDAMQAREILARKQQRENDRVLARDLWARRLQRESEASFS